MKRVHSLRVRGLGPGEKAKTMRKSLAKYPVNPLLDLPTAMKATILTSGRQFTVKQGDILTINQLPESKEGDTITFDKVVFLGEGAAAKIGTPLVAGAKVTAKLLENKRGDKIRIFKHRRRKGYYRRRGHRQELSVVKIESIQG